MGVLLYDILGQLNCLFFFMTNSYPLYNVCPISIWLEMLVITIKYVSLFSWWCLWWVSIIIYNQHLIAGCQDDNGNDKKTSTAPGVNEDIINAIKAGQFTLRKARKEKEKENKEQPKAVSELLNILGSLRRAPKKRKSQYFGDVQS